MLNQRDLDEVEKLVKDAVKTEVAHLPTKADYYHSDRLETVEAKLGIRVN